MCTAAGESRSWFWSAHFVIRRPHYCCPFILGPKPFFKTLCFEFCILRASPGNFIFSLLGEAHFSFLFWFHFGESYLQSCFSSFFNSVIAFYTTLTCSMILVLCSSPLGALFWHLSFWSTVKSFSLSVSI